MKSVNSRLSLFLFYFALALVVYMPLHVFIVQSASLVTGGLEVWKALKDVLVVVLAPLFLFVANRQKLFTGKYFWHFVLGISYIVLHLLFVLFDGNDDTYSAIVGSVYNTRLLVYFLLGLVVGSLKDGEKYLEWFLTAVVIVASAVSLFGVLQYFLPTDLLTHVGYSLERGVKPLFFIDDKPDLPRVMSTLKDPNSLGAYLILPILLTGYAYIKNNVNKKLFVRPFRREVLAVMLAVQIIALALTFSRGAILGLVLGIVTILCIVTGRRGVILFKRYWLYFVLISLLIFTVSYAFWNTYTFQNIVFHADESTLEADPNEKRVTLLQDAIDGVVEEPIGHGPGSAGIVAIKNPKGVLLTENYYLQIGYEVGWLGIALLLSILVLVGYSLYKQSKTNEVSVIILASLVGHLFYSLLIHLWSNEAVALQWWLLAGTILSLNINKKQHINLK